MLLSQANVESTTEEVLKGIEKFENLDFSKVKMSLVIEKLLEWATTTGFKLIVGALIISIGFKLIKKLVEHFINFLERRDVDLTLRKFLKSLITVTLKIILVMPVLGYWGIELSGIASISSISWGCYRSRPFKEVYLILRVDL